MGFFRSLWGVLPIPPEGFNGERRGKGDQLWIAGQESRFAANGRCQSKGIRVKNPVAHFQPGSSHYLLVIYRNYGEGKPPDLRDCLIRLFFTASSANNVIDFSQIH